MPRTSLQYQPLGAAGARRACAGERLSGAIAALQQLTSLNIHSDGAASSLLPPASILLPTSLQRLVYECGELPRQISQLTRLERLSFTSALPASLALPRSLRALVIWWCTEVPAQLAQLTRLEELALMGRGELVRETNQHVTALARLTRVRVAGGGHLLYLNSALTDSKLSALAAHVVDASWDYVQRTAPQLDRADQPAQASTPPPWPIACSERAATAGQLDAAHVAAH